MSQRSIDADRPIDAPSPTLGGPGVMAAVRRGFLATRPPFLIAAVTPVATGTAWAGANREDYDGYQGHLRAPTADYEGDAHLRSCNAVKGYHILASDGEIGHVQGFLIDDATWSIRYMLVNTSNWWVGHEVLVSPEWIKQVSWVNSNVEVSISRQAIKDARLYNEDTTFDRDREFDIYKHYGRNPYWKTERGRDYV